jgi:hypothetical protein
MTPVATADSFYADGDGSAWSPESSTRSIRDDGALDASLQLVAELRARLSNVEATLRSKREAIRPDREALMLIAERDEATSTAARADAASWKAACLRAQQEVEELRASAEGSPLTPGRRLRSLIRRRPSRTSSERSTATSRFVSLSSASICSEVNDDDDESAPAPVTPSTPLGGTDAPASPQPAEIAAAIERYAAGRTLTGAPLTRQQSSMALLASTPSAEVSSGRVPRRRFPRVRLPWRRRSAL